MSREQSDQVALAVDGVKTAPSLPLGMRAANWWNVYILRRKWVHGFIEYAPKGSKGFTPQFEVIGPFMEDGTVEQRAAEFIEKRPRKFNPAREVTHNQACVLKASNALHRGSGMWTGSGGSFSESVSTRGRK